MISCRSCSAFSIGSRNGSSRWAAQTPVAARAALDRLHPVGRVGRPTDVGDLAVYLASDRSAFLTGEVIVLDGGRMATLPLQS